MPWEVYRRSGTQVVLFPRNCKIYRRVTEVFFAKIKAAPRVVLPCEVS